MSRLADILRIDNHVVAIYRAPSVPEDADVCGPKCCIPPLLMKCNRLGTKCAADSEHITCHGAVSGLGFGGIPDRERTSCSLSRFPEGAESNHGKGKRYFANPECAMCQIIHLYNPYPLLYFLQTCPFQRHDQMLHEQLVL